MNASREGFEPFARAGIQLAAGDVFALEFKMKAVPTGAEGLREIPRLPELGPKPPAGPEEPVVSSTYRNLPSEPPPGDTGEGKPLSPVPSDEQVFSAVPNRWDYEFPTDYHRYPNFEVPYVKGHWYDPFNRNKLKGDYPIIGQRDVSRRHVHQRHLGRRTALAHAERFRFG